MKKPGLDPAVSVTISNLSNISKFLEGLFLTRSQSHITISPNFKQIIANSFCRNLSYSLSRFYHAAGHGLATLLSLDLIAAYDTIDNAIHLNRISLPVSASWVFFATE